MALLLRCKISFPVGRECPELWAALLVWKMAKVVQSCKSEHEALLLFRKLGLGHNWTLTWTPVLRGVSRVVQLVQATPGDMPQGIYARGV